MSINSSCKVFLVIFNREKMRIIRYDSISSTMDIVANHLRKKSTEPFLIIADEQLEGKGRENSKWVSPKGGFYGTYVLALEKSINQKQMRMIHYITALSIQQTLKELYKLDIKIKWPNDIYLNNKKLGGILLEIHSSQINHLLIGIGLNINIKKEDLNKVEGVKATSISEEIKCISNMGILIESLTETLFAYLEKLKSEHVNELISEYNTNLLNLSKMHRYMLKKYNCDGINNEGLLVLVKDNEIINIQIEESKNIHLID